MIPHDYHIHTNFSCDCDASMLRMCQAALKKGISEIGFSDHLDFHPQDECCNYFKADAWWNELERCRTIFKGSLTIRAGIEIGEPHRFANEIKPLLDQYAWDYCLGSLHWVGDLCVFDHRYFDREADVAYQNYFTELLNMVSHGNFDTLAHVDVVKRYGHDIYGWYDPSPWEKGIRRVLRKCAQRGIALEINTSTLRRNIGETSPRQPLLTWFKEEGGRWLTLGSDAHEPDHVGFGLDSCISNIREAGFNVLARFKSRNITTLEL